MVSQKTRNLVNRQEVEKVGKYNTFNLSHAHISTFTSGKLIPCLCRETLPNDYWEIYTSMFFRFAPLYLPIFQKMNVELSYFYVPNRIMWPGKKQNSWQFFITDDSSGVLPKFKVSASTMLLSNSIYEYLGIPSLEVLPVPSITTMTLNAFKPAGYLMIWDQYYRNDQLQPERAFELTNVEATNTANFLAAFAQYGDETNDNFLPLWRNWNRDLFTIATPTPQLGADVLVPIMRNDTVDQLDPSWQYLGPTNWKRFNDTDAPAGTLITNGAGQTMIGADGVYLDVQETSATIRDLRFAISMTEWLEKAMRAGDRYSDVLWAFFHSDPFPLLIELPAHLGSVFGTVQISEVMATAETGGLSVGNYAGQALMSQGGKKVKYKCYEHGYIYAIVSVYPQSSYAEGLEKDWLYDTRFDYYWEQFALIGDDAIFGREVNFQYGSNTDEQEYNDGVWGYSPRYNHLRSVNDVYAGQMRNNLESFHLGRKFEQGNLIQLNDEFIVCAPDIPRVFQVNPDGSEHEIYAYIWHDIMVRRQIPKFGIPAT